jgi:hypothetical protein
MTDRLDELKASQIDRNLQFLQKLESEERKRDRAGKWNPLSTEAWNWKRQFGDLMPDGEVTVSMDDFNALRNMPTFKRNFWQGGGEFTSEYGKGSGYDGNNARDFVNNFNIKDVVVNPDTNQVTLRFTDQQSATDFDEGFQQSKRNILINKNKNQGMGTYLDTKSGSAKDDITINKQIKLEERKQEKLAELEKVKVENEAKIDKLLRLKEMQMTGEQDILKTSMQPNILGDILNRVVAGNRKSVLPSQIRIGQ